MKALKRKKKKKKKPRVGIKIQVGKQPKETASRKEKNH
jgi:hypothetical protein